MNKPNPGYTPPFTISSIAIHLISEISETLAVFSASKQYALTPMLRRGNRLRSIQASLAIENNSLSLEQVTAIVDGKRVLGLPREIKEVTNAFAAYELLETVDPASITDLLKIHAVLMEALVDEVGCFRSGGVGITNGERMVHVAPPAARVPDLMADLLGWLKTSDVHPLIASSVFHYEFEFIHPFADGNGRMGRLWQTLILSRWRPLLAFLPVETVIRNRQADYYQVLASSDQQGNSSLFIDFLLSAILESLQEAIATPAVSPEVTPEVERLLSVMDGELTRAQIQGKLGLKDEKHFRQAYQQAAVAQGLIEMTIPDKPNSRLQKYRLTAKGSAYRK